MSFYKKDKAFESDFGEDNFVQFVEIKLIRLSSKNRKRLERDKGQINEMRKQYEHFCNLPPVRLIKRDDGFYDIDDGRHRFLAQEMAGFGVLEAVIVNV